MGVCVFVVSLFCVRGEFCAGSGVVCGVGMFCVKNVRTSRKSLVSLKFYK